ncbi:MAG: hydrogenase subunit MbhD domain-containing protein [Synergistota bacterium]|nr:hydrogenase subunit MbhD domain-containing protein [Synergistota bacterium]
MNEIAHIAVLALITLAAFYAVWFRDLLSSVVSLAVFSLLLSLEFFILQAPDVAIAEAAIGAGLSTAIYIIALRACKTGLRKSGGD